MKYFFLSVVLVCSFSFPLIADTRPATVARQSSAARFSLVRWSPPLVMQLAQSSDSLEPISLLLPQAGLPCADSSSNAAPATVYRAPPLALAQRHEVGAEIELDHYLVSEKFDGARVWWNGCHLLSRSGNIYRAPSWFTESLPAHVLDGELWMGRGQFQKLMRTIRDEIPDEDAWRSVRFMVFDAPEQPGNFKQRQSALATILVGISGDQVSMVKQYQLSTEFQLQQMLSDVTSGGAEGLILQRVDSGYFSGRHSGFLKLKPHSDAEAVVTGYTNGKGKYKGMTGALIVVDSEGRQFKLGSGLTDKDRKSPPPVGALVTYRFQGRTQSGKPRFARYLRVRPAE